jgi:hypothetical protein
MLHKYNNKTVSHRKSIYSSLSPVAIDQGLVLEPALGALAVASREAKELLGGFVTKGKGE